MATFTREQRDAVRADLLLDLTEIRAVHRLLSVGKFVEAQRCRQRFEEDMRLLDDLGWEEIDERERFELTMAPEQLAAVLRRLLERAGEDLDCARRELGVERHPWQKAADHAEQRAAIRREIDEDLDVRSACVAALAALGAS
jgi:hypothetical protein